MMAEGETVFREAIVQNSRVEMVAGFDKCLRWFERVYAA
jgi:hypothetical protein